MAHASYAQLGNVIFRFARRKDRDAWVAAAPRGELRRAVLAREIPFRVVTRRLVDGLEVREGPGPAAAEARLKPRANRRRAK